MYRTDLSARDEFRYTHEEGFAATSSGAKGMLTGIAKLHTDDTDQYRNGEYGVILPTITQWCIMMIVVAFLKLFLTTI